MAKKNKATFISTLIALFTKQVSDPVNNWLGSAKHRELVQDVADSVLFIDDVAVSGGIAGKGISGDAFRLDNASAANQTLVWSGTAWGYDQILADIAGNRIRTLLTSPGVGLSLASGVAVLINQRRVERKIAASGGTAFTPTLSESGKYFLLESTAGTMALDLPALSGLTGFTPYYAFKNNTGANAVTFSIADTETITTGVNGVTETGVTSGGRIRYTLPAGKGYVVAADPANSIWYVMETIRPANIERRMAIPIPAGPVSGTLTTGTRKMAYTLPFDFFVEEVQGSMVVAPVGASFVMDANINGTSILNTNKITIEAGEFSSLTAATAPGIATNLLLKGQELVIDIDAVGPTTSGAGPVVTLIGYIPY